MPEHSPSGSLSPRPRLPEMPIIKKPPIGDTIADRWGEMAKDLSGEIKSACALSTEQGFEGLLKASGSGIIDRQKYSTVDLRNEIFNLFSNGGGGTLRLIVVAENIINLAGALPTNTVGVVVIEINLAKYRYPVFQYNYPVLNFLDLNTRNPAGEDDTKPLAGCGPMGYYLVFPRDVANIGSKPQHESSMGNGLFKKIGDKALNSLSTKKVPSGQNHETPEQDNYFIPLTAVVAALFKSNK